MLNKWIVSKKWFFQIFCLSTAFFVWHVPSFQKTYLSFPVSWFFFVANLLEWRRTDGRRPEFGQIFFLLGQDWIAQIQLVKNSWEMFCHLIFLDCLDLKKKWTNGFFFWMWQKKSFFWHRFFKKDSKLDAKGINGTLFFILFEMPKVQLLPVFLMICAISDFFFFKTFLKIRFCLINFFNNLISVQKSQGKKSATKKNFDSA